MIKLEVTGDFLVESSLARVNRGLFGALARRDDVDLAILAEPAAVPIAGSSDDALLQAARTKRFFPDPDVTLRHRWPAVFPRVRAGAYVHMQAWEFGSLPKRWVEEVREVADEVWCYSTYVAQMYLRAGISPDRVHVVPLGYDPQIFAPGPPPHSARLRGRCVFLYVGDTVARKGVDVAVNAYMNAFTAHDNVVLLIKDFGAKSPGDDTRLRDQIVGLTARQEIPPVLYVDTFYTDTALADLYRAATLVVAPYRGEGFGLPILEAMACGIATLATRGGATDDFTDESTTIHVDAKPVELGTTYAGFELCDEAVLLEPDERQVVEAMRKVYADPEAAHALGRRAAEVARAGWTWAHSAQKAAERLAAVVAKEPLSAHRAPPTGELNRFELKIASRGGEDGILLELFRRIGVSDPYFVEFVTPGSDAAATVFLARSLGWRGAIVEATAAAYGDVARNLAARDVPKEFELLVLGAGGETAFDRFGEYRPKVVLTDGAAPPRELAAAHGYVLLGVESSGTSAFFVREDVFPRTRL